MADLEIRVTSRSQGGGFDQAIADARKVETALRQVGQAAKIDGKVTIDDSDVKATITTVKGLDGQSIDLKVIVDDAGIRRAEGDIRDLDQIPAPTVKVNVDTSEIAGDVEGAFAEIDPGDIAGTLQGKLTSALGAAGGVGAVVGLAAEAWGDDLVEGFTRGFNKGKLQLDTQIKTGFSEVELRPIGRAAGEAWSDGFGEGLQQLTLAGATLKTSLGDLDRAMDLTAAIESAQVLEDHLGVRVPQSALLAARMIRTGLADDTVEAMDIMTYATQTFGETGLEALEVMREFSPVFGRMGIDGAAGVDFIARSFAEGLLPTIDRGGELLEEFQIRITDLDSQRAIEQLGLDFKYISDLLAEGKGAQALDLVTTALLNMKDKSEQATLANIIFGAAMESAFDRPELIARLNDLSTAQLDVAGSSERAVEQARAMQTEWDKTQRSASELGEKVGSVAAAAFSDLAGAMQQSLDGFGLWGDTADNVSGKVEALGDAVLFLTGGPLAVLVDDLARSAAGIAEQLPFWESWWGEADHVATSLDYAGTAMTGAREAAGELTTGTVEATDALAEAKFAVDALADAIDAFSGRFDEDQIMRRIEEETIAATEAVKGLEEGAYQLGEGFDISTAAGRAAEAALEDLSGTLDQAIAAYEQGSISGQTLADTHARVEAAVREVAAAMGATQAETDELVAKYATVPPEVSTVFRAETQAAMGAVAAYAGAILAVPTSRVTTLTTYQQTVIRPTASDDRFGRAHGGVVGAAAAGGVRDGWTWVGEAGPELAKLAPGSQVATHGDSMRMAAAVGDGWTGPPIVVHVHGSVITERDLAERLKETVFAGDFSFTGRG